MRKKQPKAATQKQPVHPWRLCPYGEHWVKAHPLHIPPSKMHVEGSVTVRHEHCARSPSGKDHLISATKEELNDPNINICAGVRWLFEKRRLASSRLKRSVSWIEVVWEYKDVKDAKTKKDAEKIKKIFGDFYEDLQKCGKN